jgi:hypothetical protein
VGRLVLATAVAALSTAACQRADDARTGDPARPTASPPPTSTPTAASTRVAEVLWPGSAAIDAAARAALRPDQLAAVRTSNVPVLVPKEAVIGGGRSTFVVKPGWYTLSLHRPGSTIVVTGTRVSHVYPHVPATPGRDRVRGVPAHVTLNEGIRSASWGEHGAQYSIELECDDPRAPLCADDAELRALADSLVYVGGAGEGGAP